MLWKLSPATHAGEVSFNAASKDHIDPDATTLTAYAVGIRIIR